MEQKILDNINQINSLIKETMNLVAEQSRNRSTFSAEGSELLVKAMAEFVIKSDVLYSSAERGLISREYLIKKLEELEFEKVRDEFYRFEYDLGNYQSCIINIDLVTMDAYYLYGSRSSVRFNGVWKALEAAKKNKDKQISRVRRNE